MHAEAWGIAVSAGRMDWNDIFFMRHRRKSFFRSSAPGDNRRPVTGDS
jgi:hypothetical protein